MKRITVTIDDELFKDLEHICCAAGTNYSKEIRYALEQSLRASCVACGMPRAANWMTSDEVWEYYILPPYREYIFCRTCWNQLVDARDRGAFEAEHRHAWKLDFQKSDNPQPSKDEQPQVQNPRTRGA